MSDTTPTPRPDDEPTPLADETEREHATGEQPLTTSSDPADHTDTGVAPTLPPDYRPVAASEHVAPEPELPAAAAPAPEAPASATPDSESESEPTEPEAPSEQPVTYPAAAEPGVEPRFDPVAAGAVTEPAEPTPPVLDSPAEPASGELPPAPVHTEAPVAAAQPAPATAAYAGPTYLQSPTPPKKRGNRGLGILIAVLAAVVFAALDLAAAYGILLLRYGNGRAETYLESYLKNWEFWVPLAVFTAAFIALVAIVNRGRWWGYVLGSVFVAALVFAGYYAAALLTERAWNFTPGEFSTFTHNYFQSNIVYLWVATAATFIALELVIWFGAWISFHGQVAKRKNAEARAAYEADLDASAR